MPETLHQMIILRESVEYIVLDSSIARARFHRNHVKSRAARFMVAGVGGFVLAITAVCFAPNGFPISLRLKDSAMQTIQMGLS